MFLQAVALQASGGALHEGAWNVETMPNGQYEIRVVAECTEEPSFNAYDSSRTSVVGGFVDQSAPELLSFMTSSMSDTLAPGDHFVLVFTEEVVCSGFISDASSSNGLTLSGLQLKITFGTAESYTTGTLRGSLDYSCQGNQIKVSIPTFSTADAAKLAGEAIKLEIIKGLYDIHGNAAAPVADRQLEIGQAGEERQQIDRKVGNVGVAVADANDRITSVNSSLASLRDGVEGQHKDLLSINTSLSASLGAKYDNLESKVASLATMMQTMLNQFSTNGQAPAPLFATCAGPALYSFNTYLRGSFSPSSATSLGYTANSDVCAAKCIDDAKCAAFSFDRKSLCMALLRSNDAELGSQLDRGRAKIYARKRSNEC